MSHERKLLCAGCGKAIPQGESYFVLRHLDGGAARGYYHTRSGIMGDSSADAPETPTASDIASVETWLGTPGEAGSGTFAVGLCQLQIR
jgi:hypothetical protein